MAPDMLDRLRAADPAARMPTPEPGERERLRRAIVATPHKARKRVWRLRFGGRTLVVLLGGAVLLGCGTVYALVTGGNATPASTIAFVRRDGGHAEIYVVRSDGSGLKRLTHSASGVSHDPIWSPDGRKIAFMHFPEASLWVMNRDGSGQRLVGESEAGLPAATFAWSPDGTKILFTVWRQSQAKAPRCHLIVDSADGSTQLGLARSRAAIAFAWSPDGRKILFSTHDWRDPERCRIAIVNADGSSRRFVRGTVPFAWSPDSSRIVFGRHKQDIVRLVIMRADGSGLRELTTAATAGVSDIVCWAPDGRITFTAPGRIGTTDICSIDAEGGAARTIVSVPHATFSLSPDKKWLAVCIPGHDVAGRLIKVQISGGQAGQPAGTTGAVLVRRVPKYFDFVATWSPDSTQIAFAGTDGFTPGSSPLYIVNADGSDSRKVPHAGRHLSDPVWQPR